MAPVCWFMRASASALSTWADGTIRLKMVSTLPEKLPSAIGSARVTVEKYSAASATTVWKTRVLVV